MTEAKFWDLISMIDRAALERGHAKAAVNPLERALCLEQDVSELMAFEETLAQKLYAIDGEIYARNAGESGFSDDGFLYMRLFVIAKGRQCHEDVLAHPEKMPKSIYHWCEPLLYVYRYAWARLSGQNASDWPFLPSVSYESGSNPRLWPG